MTPELDSGGGGTTQATSGDFIGENGIQWRSLGRALVVSLWFRVALAVAGLIELLFGLLGSVVDSVYGAYETLLGLPFNGWADLLATAWDAAAQSLVGSFGLFAWIAAVVVVAAFFYVAGRALQTFLEGVTP